MNEKIKELMKEANKDVPLGKDFWLGLEQFSEKFAELIVRRVISVYNNSETFKTSTYDDNRVLEYFGVEE